MKDEIFVFFFSANLHGSRVLSLKENNWQLLKQYPVLKVLKFPAMIRFFTFSYMYCLCYQNL